MIIKTINGDLLQAQESHIIFPLNVEGQHTKGFVRRVVELGFYTIFNSGLHPDTLDDLCFGDVVSKEIKGKTYHGIVCYSLEKGFDEESSYYLYKALETFPQEGPLAILDICSEFATEMDVELAAGILLALKSTNQELVVYTSWWISPIFWVFLESRGVFY